MRRREGSDKTGIASREPNGTLLPAPPVRPDRSWIEKQCGEVAFRIFNALPAVETEGRTDFDLASDLDLPMAQVRKGLYLLQDNGLAKRHEHRSGPLSVPGFYTYHANWPRAPPAAPAEEIPEPTATDVPECYR